jgi:hypothetical protein
MTLSRLVWNTPGITSELFDDEVVIVNFESGRYHSLQGSGRLIWQWLEAPVTLDQILSRAATDFSGDREEIDRDIRDFVATLQAEGLIAAVASDAAARMATNDAASASIPFTPPLLNTFSDMQELLLLDPIHDVDEAGWPVVRENGGE